MNEFYITKVLAKGLGKADSFVDLRPGLNLIQGRSNTGKTCILKCIDFCFGSKNKPFDESFGYDTIVLCLHTPKGNIQITRSFNKNKVDVVTDVPGYNNGIYDLKKSKKVDAPPVLGDLILASIGIEDEQFIYKNKYYDTQRMSYRTILPLVLFSTNDIIKETSVIEPRQATERTAFLSALLLLLYGSKSSQANANIKKEIRVAKKNAVEEYVNKKISDVAEKKRLLEEQLAYFSGLSIEDKMQEILDDIRDTEAKITKASSQSRKILNQIIELQQEDAECSLLQSRYAALRGQYFSDIKRLSFIVDGEASISNVPHSMSCPFCNGTLPTTEDKSYIESAGAELHKITSQMNGLVEIEKELVVEKEDIAADIDELEGKRQDIEKIINEELIPKADSLKKIQDDYRSYIQIMQELSVISDFAESLETDLRELPIEKEDETEYHPKDHFDKAFVEKLDKILKAALTECNFPNLTTAHFNISSFDVEINGHVKQNFNGQGYTSFLNSIVAMSFRQYLSENAVYDPGLLVIDTPLLGLDQGVSDVSPESMRASLYNYFASHQDYGQVILLDNINNIPDVDLASKGANIITFTKNQDSGRYGFLNGITD